MTRTDSLLDLAELVLRFSRVERATVLPDGITPETDGDHTVMLTILACQFAAQYAPELNLGKISQYASVHDFPEVYAGDTDTIFITDEGRAAKAQREEEAVVALTRSFGADSWLIRTIAAYESQADPEARLVKGLDKLLPRITNILNDGALLKRLGLTDPQVFADSTLATRNRVIQIAPDIPALHELSSELERIFCDLCQRPPNPSPRSLRTRTRAARGCTVPSGTHSI